MSPLSTASIMGREVMNWLSSYFTESATPISTTWRSMASSTVNLSMNAFSSG